MSLASRAYKILCSRYREVLSHQQVRRRQRTRRPFARLRPGRGDLLTPFERLEPRVFLSAVPSVDPLEGLHAALVATNISATFDENINHGPASPPPYEAFADAAAAPLTTPSFVLNGDSTGRDDILITDGLEGLAYTNPYFVSWTAPFSGSFQIDGESSNIDSQVVVATGASITSFDSLALFRINDDCECGANPRNSRIVFSATVGTTYHIRYAEHNEPGPQGAFTLSLLSAGGQTLDITDVTPGTFIDVAGVAADTVLTFDTTPVVSGTATPGFQIIGDLDHSGTFSEGDRFGTVVAESGLFSFEIPAISSGTSTTLSYGLLPNPPSIGTPLTILDALTIKMPPYEVFADAAAAPLTAPSFVFKGDSTGRDNVLITGGLGGVAYTNPYFVSWTAPFSGSFQIDGQSSIVDSQVVVATGSSTASFDSLTFLAVNDDCECGASSGNARLNLMATAGTTYHIRYAEHDEPGPQSAFALSLVPAGVQTLDITSVTPGTFVDVAGGAADTVLTVEATPVVSGTATPGFQIIGDHDNSGTFTDGDRFGTVVAASGLFSFETPPIPPGTPTTLSYGLLPVLPSPPSFGTPLTILDALTIERNNVDLSIIKTSSQVAVVQGETVIYTIVVTNNGPLDVTDATVSDTFPASLTEVTWTAQLTGTGAANLEGAGDLNELIDLAASSFIMYTVTGMVVSVGTANQVVDAIVTNLATVTAPAGINDTNLSNNGDHDSDVIVLAVTGGTGVFEETGQSLGNRNSLRVTLGDVDGDGDLDAFVANLARANRVWLNDSGGNFIDSGQSLGYHFSLGVSLGDLDGDGDLDAFVANYVQGNRAWINDGAGNFTDSGQALGNHNSRRVILGDVDGDGDLDAFVVTNNQANRVWVNDGSGNFTDSGQSLGNHNSLDVTLGDVDGDGDLDAFVANLGQANRSWVNDGSGNFTDSGQVLGNHYSYGVTFGDVDSDGDLDAFVANTGNHANRVWINDGSGNFTDSGQALGNHKSLDVTLGDVDGDGDLDAFVVNSRQGNRVWLNDSRGNFTDSTLSLGNHQSTSISLGDLDGDGDLDAIVANNVQNRVWLNRDGAEVVGRHIFYNNSFFDGNNASQNSDDDAAIATDKQALLTPGKAMFANYTSFSRGINGIMVDIANAADASLITETDFSFMVSADGMVWTNAPTPESMATRVVEVGGKMFDRVTFIWDDNEIQNTWLEVTIAANLLTTGLATPDVFYFGNAIGETGNKDGVNATVNVSDLIAVRQNASPIGTAESIRNLYDFNRDTRVDLFDLIIVRGHASSSVGELSLITAPSLSPPVSLIDAAPASLTVDAVVGESTSSRDVSAPNSPQRIRILQSAMHQWRLTEWQDGRGDRIGESRRVARHGQVLTKVFESIVTGH